MEPDVSAAMLRRVEELQRLADSVAEHHPYWPLLHFLLQLVARVVEKWRDGFTEEELEEVRWLVEKIKDAVDRLGQSRQD
ncbi:MAG: hypothetical protein ACK4SY_07315 [Pyrobaculum sp.]